MSATVAETMIEYREMEKMAKERNIETAMLPLTDDELEKIRIAHNEKIYVNHNKETGVDETVENGLIEALIIDETLAHKGLIEPMIFNDCAEANKGDKQNSLI